MRRYNASLITQGSDQQKNQEGTKYKCRNFLPVPIPSLTNAALTLPVLGQVEDSIPMITSAITNVWFAAILLDRHPLEKVRVLRKRESSPVDSTSLPLTIGSGSAVLLPHMMPSTT